MTVNTIIYHAAYTIHTPYYTYIVSEVMGDIKKVRSVRQPVSVVV